MCSRGERRVVGHVLQSKTLTLNSAGVVFRLTVRVCVCWMLFFFSVRLYACEWEGRTERENERECESETMFFKTRRRGIASIRRWMTATEKVHYYYYYCYSFFTPMCVRVYCNPFARVLSLGVTAPPSAEIWE